MIYTSYYANMRKIPENICRVNIARVLPSKIKIDSYESFFPTKNILHKYKYTDWYGEEEYIKDYKSLVLNKLNANEVVSDLYTISEHRDVVLVCYEKSGDFCHRNIISEWLNENGYECKEWSNV